MNRKNYWYVLVCTENGCMFVTECSRRDAFWNKLDKPMLMSKEYAYDVALGLCLNGFSAFAVCQPFEIEHQPYAYDKGHFEWVKE